jgi:hypothetical protein
MTGSTWRSAFVAALFAVHPMHVESVAWVSERKDVLAATFWLLTMWAYVRYARKTGSLRYGIVAFALTMGLLAKPMVATLPLVLLLLDVWPLKRVTLSRPDNARWRSVIIEKVPLLALATGFLVWTLVAQRGIGAVATLDALPFPARLANASMSLVKYIDKLACRRGWPCSIPIRVRLDLVADRLRGIPAHGVVCCVALCDAQAAPAGRVALVSGHAGSGHRTRSGRQPRDGRSVHVPPRHWPLPHSGVGRARIAVDDLPVSICRPGGRTGHGDCLRDCGTRTSWLLADERDALGPRARGDRGQLPRARGDCGSAVGTERIDEAIVHYSEAVRLAPGEAEWHVNLGQLLVRKGEIARAAESFDRAVRLRPQDAESFNNLGAMLARLNRTNEAIAAYTRALEIRPQYALARRNLGIGAGGRKETCRRASRCALDAIRQSPNEAAWHYEVAMMLLGQRRVAEAIVHLNETLRLDPSHEAARQNAGGDREMKL